MSLDLVNLRRVISNMILKGSPKRRISECIVVAGQAGNQHVIAKTRDRNYKPDLKLIRELFPNNLEVVYMLDSKTKFLEGMNSQGLGILNSTLMVYEDENPLQGGSQKNYGIAIMKALLQSDIQAAIEILNDPTDGLEGHTIIGNAEEIYVLERTGHHDTVINKLDPAAGFDVRTNHGLAHPDAGYTIKDKPDDYLSSKIRKATAELKLGNINNYLDIAPALLSRGFEKDSNFNTFRRTDNLRTTSQVTMNLPQLEFMFYVFPNECTFEGIEDNTPQDYNPLINVRIFKWNEN